MLTTQTKEELTKLCTHYGFDSVSVCLTSNIGTGKTQSNCEEERKVLNIDRQNI